MRSPDPAAPAFGNFFRHLLASPAAVSQIGTSMLTASSSISTGHLPPAERVRALIAEAHERFKSINQGKNADYIPALAEVPGDLFGVCVVGTGAAYAAGDTDYEFSIQSVSKPFVFALVCQAIGYEEARAKLGVNSTGLPFNSVMAVELDAERTMNPMVNAGAIATTSLAPGATADEKWQSIRDGLSRFAGAELDSEPARSTRPRRPPTCATRASPTCSRATTGSTSTPTRRPTSTPDSAR